MREAPRRLAAGRAAGAGFFCTRCSNRLRTRLRVLIRSAAAAREGEEGDNFYVVEQGSFEASVGGARVASYEGRGSFGELALMYNCPRAATVTGAWVRGWVGVRVGAWVGAWVGARMGACVGARV